MLKIISILTLVYCLSSTALPEGDSNHDAYQGYNAQNQRPLPLHLADVASKNYYESGGKQAKPCPWRQEQQPLNAANEELQPTPTYSARVVKFQDNALDHLKPESLKNVEAYDSVLELYSSKHPKSQSVVHAYTKEENDKLSQNDKLVKDLSDEDDDEESVDRNASHEGTDDPVKYSDQKYKTNDEGKLDNTQSGSQLGNTNTKTASKNENYESDELSAENYSNRLQDQSKEVDAPLTKSSNKYLTLAHYDKLKASLYSDKLNDASSGDKNAKALNEDLSDTLTARKSAEDHSNDSEGVFHELAKNKYYSDELNENVYGKVNTDSDEVEDILSGILRNKADSDELNEALFEIRKHLTHSDELINAVKEVGRKGKVYSGVLNHALYKVKKHKDQSIELNSDSAAERSAESDLSDSSSLGVSDSESYSNEKYEKDHNQLLNKSNSDQLYDKSELENSDEEDRLLKKLNSYQLPNKSELVDYVEEGELLKGLKSDPLHNKSVLDDSDEEDTLLKQLNAQRLPNKSGLLDYDEEGKLLTTLKSGKLNNKSELEDSDDEDDLLKVKSHQLPNISELGDSTKEAKLLNRLKSDELSNKSEREDSDEEYKSFKKLKSDQLARKSELEDYDDDVRRCPSNKKKLSENQAKNKDVTRRLLSDSEGLASESLSSTSHESVEENPKKNVESKSSNKLSAQKVNVSNKLVAQKANVSNKLLAQNVYASDNKAKHASIYESDEGDSETAEDKEGNDTEDSAEIPKARLGLSNPAQGSGVSSLLAKGLSLIDHRRVCYACSSDFNAACFQPDKRTTVKYCHFGHDMCITKTYTDPSDQHEVVIRDCGDSCAVGTKGVGPVWNSCEVCESDLCNSKPFEPNGAFSINSQTWMFTIFTIFAIKIAI